jgi:hypothetical protein
VLEPKYFGEGAALIVRAGLRQDHPISRLTPNNT